MEWISSVPSRSNSTVPFPFGYEASKLCPRQLRVAAAMLRDAAMNLIGMSTDSPIKPCMHTESVDTNLPAHRCLAGACTGTSTAAASYTPCRCFRSGTPGCRATAKPTSSHLQTVCWSTSFPTCYYTFAAGPAQKQRSAEGHLSGLDPQLTGQYSRPTIAKSSSPGTGP